MPNRLIKFRPVSDTTDTPEAGPGSAQQFEIPVPGLTDGAGVVAGKDETLYVSDFTQHCIYKIRRGFPATVFAGSYGVSGLADGQGTAARFNKPGAMARDNSGNIWLIDVGNGKLRRITENGQVYTVGTVPVPAGADEPGHITVDASGSIFLIDSTT
jgi:sugar lactone lactonase YvrE